MTTMPCGTIKTLGHSGDFHPGAGGHVKMMTVTTMTANGFWYFAVREVQIV